MTFPSIIPILVALLAPSPEEPASEATTTPAATDVEPEGSAEADAPADTPPEAPPEGTAPEATAPTTVTDPFAAPPPTAAIPPPPPKPAPTRTPRPISWRLDFDLGFGSTVVQDHGYRAFNHRRNLLDLDTSAIFDFRLAEGRFFVGGGVAYQLARSSRSLYESQLYSSVRLHEPRVVGRMSFMIVEGIDVFARVGVGPSIVDIDFDSSPDYADTGEYSYGYQYAQQRRVLPRVDGQGGLSLYLPKKWLPNKQAGRVTAGLNLSLGYTWRGKIDVRPKLVQGDDPLRATTTPFGELSLHGLSWGVGLFLRVM